MKAKLSFLAFGALFSCIKNIDKYHIFFLLKIEQHYWTTLSHNIICGDFGGPVNTVGAWWKNPVLDYRYDQFKKQFVYSQVGT